MFITRSTLLLVAFVLVLPIACAKDEGDPAGTSGGSSSNDAPVSELVCPAHDLNAFPEMAPFVVEKASYSSPLDGAFSVSPTGSPRYSIALEIPPGRRMAPNLELILGNAEVSIAGLSSIHRCGANLAQDGEIRGVSHLAKDNYCFNGERLIQIDTGKDSIGHFAEYRTAVDSHTKILGYGAAAAEGFDVTYFVALSPNGTISHFGKSQNARVLWRGVTRSWNIEREMDRRGNTILYDYKNTTVGAKDFTTRENVISKIRFTGPVHENGVLVSYLDRGRATNCNG